VVVTTSVEKELAEVSERTVDQEEEVEDVEIEATPEELEYISVLARYKK
jgi:hypothetical protein